jgi:hypothetical protein
MTLLNVRSRGIAGMAQCALVARVGSIPQGISARGKAQHRIIHEELPTPILL